MALLATLKPGDRITLDSEKYVNSVTLWVGIVANNSPETEKIWLDIVGPTLLIPVLEYSDMRFRNFVVLNPTIVKNVHGNLDEKLKEAVEKEDYKQAAILRDKIKKHG